MFGFEDKVTISRDESKTEIIYDRDRGGGVFLLFLSAPKMLLKLIFGFRHDPHVPPLDETFSQILYWVTNFGILLWGLSMFSRRHRLLLVDSRVLIEKQEFWGLRKSKQSYHTEAFKSIIVRNIFWKRGSSSLESGLFILLSDSTKLRLLKSNIHASSLEQIANELAKFYNLPLDNQMIGNNTQATSATE